MSKKSTESAKSLDEQVEIISQGTVDIVPLDLLKTKIARSIKEGEPLIVKQGFDPTAPDIHLGHTVGLRKLRQFQDLGHKVVFLIGDFTGTIGDPSGQGEIRKRMTHEEMMENAKTYTEQAFKILEPHDTIIDYNSRWRSKMEFADVLRLAATQTVAQMIERDDFNKRFKEGRPISLLEFVYPLAQGYDSVALNSDVEIGGTEQTFNLLMARDIQRQYGQEPQVILTLPILEGIDGVEKMSKSLGNYIGISEPPEEIFGKTMSIPDELIVKYFQLVSGRTPEQVREIEELLAQPDTNPSHLKRELARDLVTQFYDEDAAAKAELHFDTIHVQKERPDDVPQIKMSAGDDGVWIIRALTDTDLCDSSSAARRMIKQGAVRLDGEKIDDVELRLPKRDEVYSIKVGKRRFVDILVV